MRCFGRSNRVRDAEVAGLNLKITQLDEQNKLHDAEVAGLNLKITQLDEKNKLLEEMKGLIEDESNLLAKELRKSDEHVTLLCRELRFARTHIRTAKAEAVAECQSIKDMMSEAYQDEVEKNEILQAKLDALNK